MISPQANDKKVADVVDVGAEDVAVGSQEEISDRAYLRSWTWSSFFRSVLLQMILFGALSLVGPAMSDAISNLGGGGLSSPWLANLSNSLNYACSFICTLFGGPLINKLGIKWSCMIAAIAMPLYGSSYYLNAKDGIDWYLLFSNIVQGFASGFLYVGETTAMLSYPKPEDRGLYLGIWSAMRNSGSVIGGAINFSTNYNRDSAGGIAWSTYLIFLGFECTGVIWAILLSSTRHVRRRDGSKVPMSEGVSWKQEFATLWVHMKQRQTWMIFIPAFYSFFYGGTLGTYLSLHFSVRARALSTLLVPSITIPSVVAFGRLLDCKWWSQRRRAWIAFLLWVIPQVGCFIWVGVEYNTLGSSEALDYGLQTGRWIKAYLPYLIIFVTGYWTQLTLYWILGTFSKDINTSARHGGTFRAFETAGQAISYGLSSASSIDHRIPFYVNCGVLALAIPCMILIIRIVPEPQTSIDVDVHDKRPAGYAGE